MAAHEHDHPHEHGSELSETQLRVRALETILTEKGYIDPAALDAIVETYETKVGPRNGALVVAKAWTDPAFKQALLKDATAAVGTLGLCQSGRRPSGCRREHAATPQHDRVHAVLLLSVGSARPAAGLVQVGALSLARGQGSTRRARRFRRHAAQGHRNPRLGFDGRDALPGAADAARRHRGLERGATGRSRHPRFDDRHRARRTPAESANERRARHGRHGRLRQGRGRAERAAVPRAWEGRVLAMQRAMGYAGAWHIDDSRYAQETLPPQNYLAASYYQRWILAWRRTCCRAAS